MEPSTHRSAHNEARRIVRFTVLLLISFQYAFAGAYTSGFYTDSIYGQTVLVNRLPGEHRRAIKREILTLLGLHHRPRPTEHGKHNSAPNYMLDLYKTLNIDDEEEEKTEYVPRHIKERLLSHNLTLPGMEERAGGADMIASFINHASKGHRLRHETNKKLYFDFSEVPPEMSVTGAELRIFKTSPDRYPKTDSAIYIRIYRVYEGDHRVQEKSLHLEANVSVSETFEGWIDMNVTNAAVQWNFFPATNLGLYMIVTDEHGDEIDPRDVGVVDRRGADDKQAFLVVFFKATQEVKSRRARGTGRKRQRTEVTMNDEPSYGGRGGSIMTVDSNDKKCKKRQLYVSFRDLGWQEWIIAPEGYSAFYCSGECIFPLNVHMNATNHAIVQTLVHLINPYMVPKPRCAPTKLTAISVLYFDDNSNVILKKYRNMVVRACGCH